MNADTHVEDYRVGSHAARAHAGSEGLSSRHVVACGQCDVCERLGVPVACALEYGSVGPVEIVVCGLNHRTAPVELLEKLAFTAEERVQALHQLTAIEACGQGPTPEAVILSTCNRVELYLAIPRCGMALDGTCGNAAAHFLARHGGLEPDEIAPYLYSHTGVAAAQHLLTVAAGLDSLVFGEPQILGQVRQAFEEALTLRAAGPLLSALFRCGLETGKRVRTETGVSQGAASVSYAAVEVAAREFGRDMERCRALVVGAGKTGQLTVEALLGRGVKEITVANRSYEHAEQLAASWNGRACGLDGLQGALNNADIVISCTNAPGYVITGGMVCRARMGGQETRPLLLIDIAVPRDIDPAATEFPGVRLCNMDDLHAVVEANLDQRRDVAGAQAEAIVAEETVAFTAWFGALAVTPVITGLREQAETIRQRELGRALNRLKGMPDNYAGIIDMLTQRIVNQILHQPTVRLKEHASQADGAAYAQALADLFGLEEWEGRE